LNDWRISFGSSFTKLGKEREAGQNGAKRLLVLVLVSFSVFTSTNGREVGEEKGEDGGDSKSCSGLLIEPLWELSGEEEDEHEHENEQEGDGQGAEEEGLESSSSFKKKRKRSLSVMSCTSIPSTLI
jgi:hypothetical protein